MNVRLWLEVLLCCEFAGVWGGDASTRVVLPQGVMTGVRLQTQRRVLVTAYLGIPYALPPLGPYRFAAPERHPGWNDSLVAEHFRPDCLQPRDGLSRQEPGDDDGRGTTSEDCLYLNVFVPAGTGARNQFPVVVFLHGHDYVTGSVRAVAAQELAADGILVVTVSYRLNVFGFLCLGDAQSRGNVGLLDQYVALLWVKENTPLLGATPDITLMGHGAGASAVVTHITSPRIAGLLTRAIVMSGSVLSPMYKGQEDIVVTSSQSIARSVGCRHNDVSTSLTCLRHKTADELLIAFQNIYKTWNWTNQLVPVADAFLPERQQYLPMSPADALLSGQFLQVPVLTGIAANEGTLLLDKWEELRSQPESSVVQFINNTAIPYMLHARTLTTAQLADVVQWRYITALTSHPLQRLVQLYTDAVFTAPHWVQRRYLTTSSKPVFAYHFTQHNSHANDVTSAAYGSELLFIFGPLRQDSVQRGGSARNPTFAEERLSLRMKRLWTTFMRTGDPNPSSSGNASQMWPACSSNTGDSVLVLFGDAATGRTMELPDSDPHKPAAAFWNDILPRLNTSTTHLQQPIPNVYLNPGECGPYKSAMFTTLFFLLLVMGALLVALFLLKRHLSSANQLTKL